MKMLMVDFSLIHHEKYFVRIKEVVAVDIRSVWTVRSFHILLVVIFHFSCWRILVHPVFAFPDPTMIGRIIWRDSRGGNISKKGPYKGVNFLGAFGGGFFGALEWRRGV
jgi:hypothetical protein